MAAEDRSMMSVMVTCRDTKKSAAFYTETLGFEMKESWPSADDPQWANLVLGGQSVMIGGQVDPEKVSQMCQGDEQAMKYWTRASEEFSGNLSGVGIQVYLQVPDVDAYRAEIGAKGIQPLIDVKSQFYGIRDFIIEDPDGYRLVFFTPITMESCQSCGMPLTEAEPGQMYCAHCTNEKGELRPYEQIFEGTVTGYFMQMQKMDRPSAETAAKEHLAKMPAWAAL